MCTGVQKKTEGQRESGKERATVACFDFNCRLCNTEEFQEASQKSKCISFILEIV